MTKCFGEALGRYLSTQEGVWFIALRIGAFQPLSTAQDAGKPAYLDAFVSQGLREKIVTSSQQHDHVWSGLRAEF